MIQEFSSISLEEMSDVKLMNRVDTKFIFNQQKLPGLLKDLTPFYQILEIKNKRIQDYRSLYYDTEDRRFYIEHHNQRVNRNKIRFREYVGSGLIFLEVKLKNNKGRTVKKRIKVKSIPLSLSKEHKNYIRKITGKDLEVTAKQWISFSRLTFMHKMQKERLTIDLDLRFNNESQNGNMNDIVIAEVKQERMSRSSDFIKITKEMSILPMRLSKYCVSTMQLDPSIKQNRFKKKLLFIDKLKQA